MNRETAEAPKHPARDDPTSGAWSTPSSGVQIKLATDKKRYHHGEHIDLTLSYRNLDSGPWMLSMSPYFTRLLGRYADAPLYGLSVLTLRCVGASTEWNLVAVPSNRFRLAGLERLDPGIVRNTHGALTTWAWTLAGETERKTSPTLDLAPGADSIAGQYDTKDLVEPGAGGDPGALELGRLRRFFAGADHSLNAFWAARFVGISYTDAELLRDSGCRRWAGALEAPASEFVVEP